MNEAQIHHETLRCKHWRGIQHDTCEAGCRWRELSPKPLTVGPCLTRTGECTSAAYTTREEVIEEYRAFSEAFAKVEAARAAIVAKVGKARGVSGELPCPCCEGGTLRYSIAKSNGHIHAGCSTKGCVRWME